MNSFIFCTSYMHNTGDHIIQRYRRWANYYLTLLNQFHADRLFLIDDGGNEEDQFFHIIKNDLPDKLSDTVNVYRFTENLGRSSPVDFPGWWRSFLFSIEIAREYGYKKFVGDRIGESEILAKWLNDQVALLSKLDYIGQMNVISETQV